MDSLLIVNGKGPGNERTVSIVGWFFAGYNLADTILAISPKQVILYASDRKSTPLPSQSTSSTICGKTRQPKGST